MSFLDHLSDLWRRERRTAVARMEAARRGTTLKERVARGDALKGVEVDDVGPAPGDRTRLWIPISNANGLGHLRLRSGTPVRLWWTDPDDNLAVRAVVERQRRDRMSVLVDGEVADRLIEGRFNIDRDDPQVTFTIGERAIRAFQTARPNKSRAKLAAVLWGNLRPGYVEPPAWRPFDVSLNRAQRGAVNLAIGAYPIALVHGPPGTGKTRTLVEVITQAVARGEKVLACAMSNTAVDHLAMGLVRAGLKIVRLGHPSRVATGVADYSLDALIAANKANQRAQSWQKEARRLRDKIRSGQRRLSGSEKHGMYIEARRLEQDARDHLARTQHMLLESASVICATAAGADARILGQRRFDLVVLDEATQCPDPLALAAFARAPKVVLAGDPEQLPPTVLDRDAARDGLSSTFFERVAVDHPTACRMLTVQYRMHASLMQFPSRTRYDGRLTAAPSVAGHTLADLGVLDDPVRCAPLVFIDTAGKGWEEAVDEGGSTFNAEQAERTAAEVRRLLSRNLEPTEVAVITPYSAQSRRLRTLLMDLRDTGLEVGTVDGFQGREKEVIVVDLVRSNPDGIVGFVSDRRRLNVAFTRARRCMIVIADSATLGRHADFAAFLSVVEECGVWVSAWTDNAEPLGEPEPAGDADPLGDPALVGGPESAGDPEPGDSDG